MKPFYTINRTIWELVTAITERIGAIKATHLERPTPELRKKNRIKTIQSSLEIEGNTLTEEQITALLDNKPVLAPKKDILEVKNAIRIYEQLHVYNPYQLADMVQAHAVLMEALIEQPGKLRTTNVGIVKGSQVQHVAPSGSMVKGLMNDLFSYLNNDDDPVLIKSCVFHYELEFIHPFVDGNGRMGRLWQHLLLMQQYPVFAFLPVESLIKQRQEDYYAALSASDKTGTATPFVEFMLGILLDALDGLLQSQNKTLHVRDRLELFKETFGQRDFQRKDYLQFFKLISAPTASRDLKWAVDQGLLSKTGKHRLTSYRFL